MLQITTKEASQILNISKRTLFRWEKEGRIKSIREGILNVRVYDRDYIVIVKKLLDLDKQIDEHQVKLPKILEQSKKRQLAQNYQSGKPLKLSSDLEVEAAIKAGNNEELWMAEHNRLILELGLLIRTFRINFSEAPLEELLSKGKRSK